MAMVKMSPDVISCSDDQGNLEVEINLPGVKKENIELKMVEDGFFIRAKREETGVEYAGIMHSAVGSYLRKLPLNTAMENNM